jgi:hypothetical protein
MRARFEAARMRNARQVQLRLLRKTNAVRFDRGRAVLRPQFDCASITLESHRDRRSIT